MVLLKSSLCRHSSQGWHWEDRKVIVPGHGCVCPPLVNPSQREQGGSCLGLPHNAGGCDGVLTDCSPSLCIELSSGSKKSVASGSCQHPRCAYTDRDVYPVLTPSLAGLPATGSTGILCSWAIVDITWGWVARNDQHCACPLSHQCLLHKSLKICSKY